MNFDRPIAFITGLHRSGTSLVHEILRDHPACSGFRDTGVPEDEGQHLQNVIPAAKAYGGPGRFGFDPRSFLDETSELSTTSHATRLRQAWERHWDLSRPLLLEKSPPTLVRTRYFQKVFPGARFLVVIRHPIAVAMATQKWSGTSPIELLLHWMVCHRRFEQDKSHLNYVHVVRYEDLVERADETFASIFNFLGIKLQQVEDRVKGGLNENYFSAWHAYLAETGGDG